MISLIAVIGKNRELGKDNQLLWHIPGDLPRFKQLTMGHPVIMGRKTQATFQYKGRPLPGRTNIVVTKDPTFHPDGFVITHSVEESLQTAKQSPGSEEIFVIGGASIYSQTISLADRLYLTMVDKTAPADSFFPEYSDFSNVHSKEPRTIEEFSITYLTLER